MRNLPRKAVPAAPPAAPGTLAAALASVPDPRRPFGWRPGYAPVPLVALLQATVVALLCGAQSQFAIAQWIRERAEEGGEVLTRLGFPAGRSVCVATLHRVYKALDGPAFEHALSGWLLTTGVAPDDALALDGKSLRGAGGAWDGDEYVPARHLVSLYAHDAQVIVAQVLTDGKGQELAAGRAVLAQVPLAGRVVTADALHTQRAFCAQVVAGGGDYLVPVKENQGALLADLTAAFSPPDVAANRPRRVGPSHGVPGLPTAARATGRPL
jgi:DDE family transposase